MCHETWLDNIKKETVCHKAWVDNINRNLCVIKHSKIT